MKYLFYFFSKENYFLPCARRATVMKNTVLKIPFVNIRVNPWFQLSSEVTGVGGLLKMMKKIAYEN